MGASWDISDHLQWGTASSPRGGLHPMPVSLPGPASWSRQAFPKGYDSPEGSSATTQMGAVS